MTAIDAKASIRMPFASSFARALTRLRDIHQDMTVAQVVCLLLVADRPGITQRDLHKLLDTTDSAASRIIALLSDVGSRGTPGMELVLMRENPNDRRERHIFLTAKGRRILEDIATDLKTGMS